MEYVLIIIMTITTYGGGRYPSPKESTVIAMQEFTTEITCEKAATKILHNSRSGTRTECVEK